VWKFALLVLAVVEVISRVPRAAIEITIGWNEREARYVLATSVHRVPIMNGVSGFDPPIHAGMASRAFDDARGRIREIARFSDGDRAYVRNVDQTH
jgi:hypothetical protein